MLRPGFFLPPLMFTADELEALVLGARWVEGRQDGSLSRAAMRAEKTLHIGYADLGGAVTERAIWPAALAYYEEKQIIAAWCLLCRDLRSFRIDRVTSARIGEEGFGRRRAVLMADWWRHRDYSEQPPDTISQQGGLNPAG